MTDDINTRSEMKKAGLGILYIICLILFIRWLDLGFWGLFFVLLALVVIRAVIITVIKRIKTKQKEEHLLKKFVMLTIKSAIFLYLLMMMFKLLIPFGWWGFFLGCIIVGVLIIWMKRKKWLKVKHYIEKTIWGKPLKDFMAEKEKPPKFKIVWRK